MYRTNTYPFIHTGFFHAFLNLLALTPLLERFEAEHGTLTAIALFMGRKYTGQVRAHQSDVLLALSTFPAGLYVLIERSILHSNNALVGSR